MTSSKYIFHIRTIPCTVFSGDLEHFEGLFQFMVFWCWLMSRSGRRAAPSRNKRSGCGPSVDKGRVVDSVVFPSNKSVNCSFVVTISTSTSPSKYLSHNTFPHGPALINPPYLLQYHAGSRIFVCLHHRKPSTPSQSYAFWDAIFALHNFLRASLQKLPYRFALVIAHCLL